MSQIRFHHQRIEELAPLAWLAVLENAAINVHVLHGKHVETCDRFFVEGIWSGKFSEGGLANTDCVFGSGGQIAEDRVVFVPSIATTDYLYCYTTEGKTFVSNSLPLILRYADDWLDPMCADYAQINLSITRGIRRFRSQIPTKKGFVRRLMHLNLEFVNGVPRVVDKPLPPRFSSFQSYKDYLTSCFSKCIANARDPARANRLHIYSTQSKGYDSTAVNAIARGVGIDAAFTVREGKANDRSAANDLAYQMDDDGTEICEALDIPVITLDRREFEKGVRDELYYWAGMHTSDDLNLCGITGYMKTPALLLTGNLGEVWYTTDRTRAGDINDELVRWDMGGHGLSESRLKTGYIQMAVPFIGARSRSDILEISNSDEMGPWRLGVAYDRPIPRRIAEEAGVPRHLFGQKKIASVVEFSRPNFPLSEDLRVQYFEFLRANRLLPTWKAYLLPLIHSYNEFASYKGPAQNIYAYYTDRLVMKFSGGRRELSCLWQYLDGSVYCFAVNQLAATFPKLKLAS